MNLTIYSIGISTILFAGTAYAGCGDFMALSEPVPGSITITRDGPTTTYVGLRPADRGEFPRALQSGDVLDITYKRRPTERAVIRVQDVTTAEGRDLRLVFVPMRRGMATVEVLLNDDLLRQIKSVTLLGMVPPRLRPSDDGSTGQTAAYLLVP